MEKGFPCQISLGNINKYTEAALPESLSNNNLMLSVLKGGDVTCSVLPTFDHKVVFFFLNKKEKISLGTSML